VNGAWAIGLVVLIWTGGGACDGGTAQPVRDTGEGEGEDASADTGGGVDADTGGGVDEGETESLVACQGAVVAMTVVRELPYVRVGVDGAEGYFLVDWGTTGSAIDAAGFAPFAPAPLAGTNNRWADFLFFGPWGTVTLSPQDFSWFADPIRQAGILGTDFLSLNTFVVDWQTGTLARAEAGAGCSDEALRAAGLRPLSTAGYYARDLGDVDPGVPNIPTIPVRVGDAQAPAQIDTGYDDTLVGPAININRAFRAAIDDALLVRAPELDLVLTTCVPGLFEAVAAWRLAAGAALELVGVDDAPVRRFADAILFVKDTPAGAFQCGGIGTWSTPGAQLGVSFVARGLRKDGLAWTGGQRAVFDPWRSRVWLPHD